MAKNRKMSIHWDDDQNNGGTNSRSALSSRAESDTEINSEQMALLESAKDKLRMATIERKRMSSINAESRGNGLKNQRNVHGVKQSKDDRLVERVRKQDETVKRQTGEIKVLRTELKTSKMQVKALREEARLSANVRIALKEQLNAEKKRNLVFEEQVGAWKKRFMQITGNGDKEDKKSSKQESR